MNTIDYSQSNLNYMSTINLQTDEHIDHNHDLTQILEGSKTHVERHDSEDYTIPQNSAKPQEREEYVDYSFSYLTLSWPQNEFMS